MTIQSRPAWISTLLQIILVMCISSPGCVTSSSFVSTPASENGVLTTCVGEQISFTCSHAGEDTSTTEWEFSPPRAMSCSSLVDHENALANRQCDPFTIQDISNTTQGILTSTAVTTANASLTGTVLECADGTGNTAIQIGSNISICVVALPSNLIIDGSRLFWSGTTCVSTTITYEVTISGPQTMVSNVTSGTSTTLSTLQPNQRYTVSVKAFGSSCSTQAAITSFVTTTNGGPTTTSSEGTGSSVTSSDPSSGSNSGVGVGLGIAIPLIIICIVVAVVVPILVYYFMFYKRNPKLSENLIQDPASLNHKYEEIKPKRKFLSIFKFKKEPEPLTFPAPAPPPPRQSDDTTKVPLEGTSVDPSSDKSKEGSSVDKKETVINIGGHSYHELDDLDQPKSQEGKEVTKKETVIKIGGHSYHELDDLDQPKSQQSKEGSSTEQKDTVIKIGGHSYHELDDLAEPKSHKEHSAKPSTNNKLLSSESAKVDPEDFDPDRRYSEIDKMKKQKDRRKKAAETAQQDPDAPPVPPAYSPTAVETGGSPASGLGSAVIDQPNADKPKESTSGSNEERTKEPAQEAPQKPPRTKTNSVSMSERPEKPKRASKAGKDLDTSTPKEPVSASDKEQLNQTTKESQDPPQKPPRSNTNTAPEKPKRVSKIDNSEQRSPSPKPSNT